VAVPVPLVLYSYRTSYISLLTYIPILLLVSMIGLAMHASYVHCDPLVSRTISSGDQVNKKIQKLSSLS